MQQKTIFIIDDNLTNLAIAEEVLEDQYTLVTLTSAENMFIVLEKVKPDLILLDIDMPGMDGLEAIKLLKNNIKYKDIPVIFLTGLTASDTEAYSLELGAVDFITKPFSSPVLHNRVRTHLRIDELIRKRAQQIDRLHRDLALTLQESEESVRSLLEAAGIKNETRVAAIFEKLKRQIEEARAELKT